MSNKIKLLYALESAGGGTLKHVHYLATRLPSEQFEITVILPTKKYEQETEAVIEQMLLKGVCIQTIPMSKSITCKDFYSLYRIYRYLKKHPYDIIHAHSSKAGALFRVAAWLTHRPVTLYTPHCFYFNAKTGWLRRVYGLSERMLGRLTDVIILSHTEKTAILEQNIRPLQKIVVINNVIDTEEYRHYARTAVRAQFQIPDRHRVVIGVGRLVKQKNWELFIDMARLVLCRNADYHFLIAGEGPLHAALAARIEKYGLTGHIQLIGYVEDISRIYSVGDLFVSTSQWEGLPYTYLEAAYFHLPMIITYTPGMEEFCKLTGCFSLHGPTAAYFAQAVENSTLQTNCCTSYPFLQVADFVRQHATLYIRLVSENSSERRID